jgi:hypothetical protein
VHVAAIIQGAAVSKDWSFTTEGTAASAPPVKQA